MKINKILLALDGSIYSSYAAQTAWHIAEITGASVTALHVVDTKGVKELIGYSRPGFLTEDNYGDEREAAIQSLTRLAHKLAGAYSEAADRVGIEALVRIEDGNPAEVIANEANNYDLVVLGHRPFDPNEPGRFQRQFHRLSVAETLAHSCPIPLLVVQNEPVDWRSLTIISSVDHINRRYIDAAVEIGFELLVQPALLCLSTGGNEECAEDLIADLRAADPELGKLPVIVSTINEYVDGSFAIMDNPTMSDDWDNWNSTLMVASTRMIGDCRVTFAGGFPERFVRYSTLPAVMLWPEEDAAYRSDYGEQELAKKRQKEGHHHVTT